MGMHAMFVSAATMQPGLCIIGVASINYYIRWVGSITARMFERILIACIGNICRSPTAEYLFRQQLGDATGERVSSAGIHAMAGYPMDPTSALLLDEHGVPHQGHRGRQLDTALLRQSSLILVMEKSHVITIGRLAPEVSGKVFLLDRWLDGADIPDPYGQQRPAFEHVYQLIDRGVASWVPYL
jgi:low molecular weight protein-tyrosine phosphatase